MNRKSRWFLGMMVLFLLVGCAGITGVKKGVPTEAVPAKAVAICTDLSKAFSYANTTLTSVSLVPAIDFVLGFNVDTDTSKIYATNSTYTESAMSFMTPPDATVLSKFIANNGKMIVVHGAADPVFSVSDTISWYEGFRTRYGNSATDRVLLFVVPGMSHSRGGPATDQFDMVDALVNWVERGIAPNGITAKARGKGAVVPAVENPEVPPSWSPGRTRPLCAYPEVPRYKGSGDIETASSFSCMTP